jgi:hypothetical protein
MSAHEYEDPKALWASLPEDLRQAISRSVGFLHLIYRAQRELTDLDRPVSRFSDAHRILDIAYIRLKKALRVKGTNRHINEERDAILDLVEQALNCAATAKNFILLRDYLALLLLGEAGPNGMTNPPVLSYKINYGRLLLDVWRKAPGMQKGQYCARKKTEAVYKYQAEIHQGPGECIPFKSSADNLRKYQYRNIQRKNAVESKYYSACYSALVNAIYQRSFVDGVYPQCPFDVQYFLAREGYLGDVPTRDKEVLKANANFERRQRGLPPIN